MSSWRARTNHAGGQRDEDHVICDLRGLLEERAELGKGRVADGPVPAPLCLEEVPAVLNLEPIRALG